MRCTIFELLFIADIATSFIFHFYTFSHEGQCFDIFPFCYSFFRYFSLSTFFPFDVFPFDIFPFRHFSFNIFTLFFLSFDIFPFDISTTHRENDDKYKISLSIDFPKNGILPFCDICTPIENLLLYQTI